MKNLIIGIALFVLTVCTTQAQTIEFDGYSFKKILLLKNLDTNKDNQIQVSEVEQLTSLDVSNADIENLKGIEFFKNLKVLNFSKNDLESVDLSKNVLLEELVANSALLRTLDVSNNIHLKILDCSYNRIENLNLSKNPKLVKLNCRHNRITALDFTNNRVLETVQSLGNRCKTLDVSGIKTLKTLWCSDNYTLTSINTTGCDNLEILELDKCRVTELDVTSNTKLKTLNCSTNQQLSTIEGIGPAMRNLNVDNNALTKIDLSTATSLYSLSCVGNNLNRLDLSNSKELNSLKCYNNNIEILDVRNAALQETYPQHNFNIRENQSLWKIYVSPNKKEFVEDEVSKISYYTNVEVTTTKSDTLVDDFGGYATAISLNLKGKSSLYNVTYHSPDGYLKDYEHAINQDLSQTFNGRDFGVVAPFSGQLIVDGAEVRTFKKAFGNTCQPNMKFRVLRLNDDSIQLDDFSVRTLNHLSECNLGANEFSGFSKGPCNSSAYQKWANYASSTTNLFETVDLTQSIEGNYQLELYYEIKGGREGGCNSSVYIKPSNSSFKAKYTICATLVSSEVVEPTGCNTFDGKIILKTRGLRDGSAIYNGRFKYNSNTSFPDGSVVVKDNVVTISGLAAGYYQNVRYSSANVYGCQGAFEGVSVTVKRPVFNEEINTRTDCSSGSGNATVIVESPFGAGYTYALDNGPFQESPTFTAVSNGYHFVTVNNSKGCADRRFIIVECGCTGLTQVRVDSVEPIDCDNKTIEVKGVYFGATGINVESAGVGKVDIAKSGLNSNTFAITYEADEAERGTSIPLQIIAVNPNSSCPKVTTEVMMTIEESSCLSATKHIINKSEVTIFPNPVVDYVEINVGTVDKMEHFEIYSTDGKQVYRGNQNTANLSDLPVGIYFVKIYTNKGLVKKKLYKN